MHLELEGIRFHLPAALLKQIVVQAHAQMPPAVLALGTLLLQATGVMTRWADGPAPSDIDIKLGRIEDGFVRDQRRVRKEQALKYVREGGIICASAICGSRPNSDLAGEETQGILCSPADSALLFEFTVHEVSPVPESQ